jgi:predicted anti-sigma-YlaC factor YlaD
MPSDGTEKGFTCREVVELATEYVDGAMSAEDHELFEVHLNYCDGCVAFIEQVRTASRLSRRINESELSPDLREKLLAAFRDWKRE